MTARVPGGPAVRSAEAHRPDGVASLATPDRTRAAWAGTGALVRLALRRDRVLLPVWIAGFTLMVVFSVTATRDLYPDDASLAAAAETINATAALVALYGKIYAVTSLGAVSLIKMTALGAAFVAILFVFLVVRHSRAEEESGRLELVAAGAVGRAAPLTAALCVGMGSAVVLGVVTGLGLGLAGLPWSGSLAFGLSWTLSGIVFSAVAAVAAQLTTSARAAIGLGMSGLAASYALRAVGDLAEGDPGWASWLSPIGWSQQIRPFAGDRWWVTLLPLLATAILVPTAFWLRARRDLGSGLLPDRPGPAAGGIRGLTGLAWRLQRGMLTAWLVGAALMGLVLGSVAHNVAGLLDSPQMRQFFERLGGVQGLTDMFLAAEIGILACVIAAYGVAASSRLRSEESAGHAELLLSHPTTRTRWAAGHVGLALAGTALLLLVTGAAIGVGHGLAIGEPIRQTARLAASAAGQIPAVWVMVAIVLLVFGWAPQGRAVGLGRAGRLHRHGGVRGSLGTAPVGAGPVSVRAQPDPARRGRGPRPVRRASRRRGPADRGRLRRVATPGPRGLSRDFAGECRRSQADRRAGGGSLVRDRMVVALGTGSTVAFLLPALAARGLDLTCVATSPATAQAAREIGLRVVAVHRAGGAAAPGPRDRRRRPGGARRVAGQGGGGAHTREKVVAVAADRFVVTVSADELVERLAPLVPLEVLEFGLAATVRRVDPVGLRGVPRSPDSGVIADYVGAFAEPAELAQRLSVAVGVVEHGLFRPSWCPRSSSAAIVTWSGAWPCHDPHPTGAAARLPPGRVYEDLKTCPVVTYVSRNSRKAGRGAARRGRPLIARSRQRLLVRHPAPAHRVRRPEP